MRDGQSRKEDWKRNWSKSELEWSNIRNVTRVEVNLAKKPGVGASYRVRGVRIIIDIYEGEIGGWTCVLSTVFLST